jgi:hypothetical protein
MLLLLLSAVQSVEPAPILSRFPEKCPIHIIAVLHQDIDRACPSRVSKDGSQIAPVIIRVFDPVGV